MRNAMNTIFFISVYKMEGWTEASMHQFVGPNGKFCWLTRATVFIANWTFIKKEKIYENMRFFSLQPYRMHLAL